MVYANLTPGVVTAAGATFPAICLVLTGFRLYVRRTSKVGWGVDDWLVIPALVLVVGMGVATLVGVSTKAEGYLTPPSINGKRPHERTIAGIIFWTTEMMQALALGCIKLSFVFFYRRIFNVRGNGALFNIISVSFIALISIWMVGFFFAMLFICPGHPSAYWASTKTDLRYCWDTTNFLLAYCFSDLITDLCVLLLPIPSVWGLQMSFKRKIAVIGVFSLGALTIAASITRAVLYVGFLKTENHTVKLDPSMLDTNGIYWMIVETGLALCAVNLPVAYGGVRRKGIENLIKRIRSFTSLRTSKNTKSSGQESSTSPWKKFSKRDDSKVSDIQMLHNLKQSETYAGQGQSFDTLEEGGIHVTRTVALEEI